MTEDTAIKSPTRVQENDTLLKNEEGINSLDAAPKEASNKSIGIFKGISFVFGNIIGSGIFISVSETFGIFSSNNIFSVILVWVFGGIVAILGSLCYAELGSRLPQSGGECVYYNAALNKKFSVLFSIMYVFVVKTITIAAIGLTASKYFVNSLPWDLGERTEIITKLVSMLIISMCFVANCITKKIVTDLSLVFLFLKILAVLFIVGPGAYCLCIGRVQDWIPPFEWKGFQLNALSLAIVNVCWSFEGWNALGLIAGEIDKPSTLLASSMVGVFGVTFAYVMTVISYSAVLGYDLVRTSETVALTFGKYFYQKFYFFISILITLSAIGSINGTFYTLSGVTVSSGVNNILPKTFSLVHPTSRIPFISLSVIALFSLGLVWIPFQKLLGYCAFVTWVFYFLSFLSLWMLRVRKPSNDQDDYEKKALDPQSGSKPFQMPYILIILLMFMCIYMVIASFMSNLVGCTVIAGCMAFIFFVQYIPFNLSNYPTLYSLQDYFYNNLKSAFGMDEAGEKDIS